MGRKAFTLIELVVFVLILGIIAAVAYPKIVDSSADARDHGTHRSLEVVRDALARWKTAKGSFPSNERDYYEFVSTQLQGGHFPSCLVGNGAPNDVELVADGRPLSGTGGDGESGDKMWKYDYSTGEMIINYNAVSKSGDRYDEW